MLQKWLPMKLCVFLRATMSKRYICLLVLISVLKRLEINYHVIGHELQDRDTVIVIDNKPIPIYLFVTNQGVTYEHSPFNREQTSFHMHMVISSSMAAIEALQWVGDIDE